MKSVLKYLILATSALGGVWSAPMAEAAPADALKGKNVVLVHGAFADGSSWDKVIALLQAKGLHVVAVQNPLTSLKDDVAATHRVIEQQNGPVILVGHSWGGVVITQAGIDDKVKALVYVAAFAPDRGQSVNDMLKGLPAPPWGASLEKDSAGFLTLSTDAVLHYLSQDLPAAQGRVIAATQGPWFSGCLDDKVTEAAWHGKPTWDVVTQKDYIIPTALQEAMAKQMKATVVKADSSHLAMVSKPDQVVAAIVAAAEAAN
ncbi:MAG TPA: alpha/beta hydrolase [Aliidongia sp.]|nr:alpha/beta hydrolase [Aliidongia sp.]